MNSSLLLIRSSGRRESLTSSFRAAARLAALSLIAIPLFAAGSPQAKTEPSVTAPNPTADAAPPALEHVKLLLDKGNPALEIETTAPVTPQINKSNEGMRLVIDLPNTNMSVADKVVPIKNRDLSEMRLNLVGSTPPSVHIEVDFRTPLGYSWDITGNRLLINFHEPGKDDADKNDPAAPANAGGVAPIPVSAPGAAAMNAADFTHLVSADQIAPGASVTAGSDTTVLRVKPAGDVYVCPQTSISVVRSRNGPDLTLAMNDGGLETHLALKNSADEVVTPDFRILLRGPGDFHYAIRSDSRGNTCVRTLPGNTASAIIYELLGDGTYNVQAGDQLVFRQGKLIPANAASGAGSVLPLECGCPPPARGTLLASSKPGPRLAVEMASPAQTNSAPSHTGSSSAPARDSVPGGSAVPPEGAVEIADLPQSVREQPHLAVEASLTFTPNPARMAASHLPASSRQLPSPITVQPPLRPAPEHKTVFGKIKSFFSRVF